MLLVVRLEDYPIERILCSPSLRCVQTVQPLAGDRFLEIELHAADISPEDAVKTVRWLESRCEECPQSGVDMAPHTTRGRAPA